MQLNFQYTTNEQVKNFPVGQVSVSKVSELLEVHAFKKAKLTTASKVFDLSISGTASARLSETELETAVPSQSSLAHDRKKARPVDPCSPFLRALKVTTESGRPLTGMADKLRQIERFVEILAGLVDSSAALAARSRHTPDAPPLRIVDMGSGLAYLTFAVHAYFGGKQVGVSTVGVEAREALVARCTAVARGLGSEFDDLSFVKGSIDDYFPSSSLPRKSKALSLAPPPRASNPLNSGVDVLIALHACDVATDHAIFSGIAHNAEVIVTSPCCQKEIRRQMEQAGGAAGLGFGALLEHGLFRERTAEMITDSIRALCLEWAGYDTTVLEFVDGQHTAKNVMIAATKRRPGEGEGQRKAKAEMRVAELMAAVGVSKHSLVELLGLGGQGGH